MRKFLLKLFIYIFLFASTLVQNGLCNEVPNKQYKKAINQVINSQIHIAKKDIKTLSSEIEKEQNPYIRQVIIEQGINEIIFKFYMELIKTTDNYININKTMPITDWHGDLKQFIEPYLKNNQINTSKIDSFLKYSYQQEKYLKNKYGY